MSKTANMNKLTVEMTDELFVRFFTDVTLYNDDMNKCFAQIMRMYYYFQYITKSPDIPSKMNKKVFINEIKGYLANILPWKINVDWEFDKWTKSRKNTPRCNVIVLDSTLENMILTKDNFNNFIGFPGGKVDNLDTNLVETAIREIYKIIGLDITNLIKPGMYFDLYHNRIKQRYYIITNFDKNNFMEPNSYHVNKYIKWFSIEDFPHNIKKYRMTEFNIKLIEKAVARLKRFLVDWKR